jgi:hypothetical protein
MALDDGDREQIIRSAIKAATDKNIKLSIQTWGVFWSEKDGRWIPKKDQKCCALSCVILECQDKLPRKTDWREYTIRAILECNVQWIESFLRGFDGYPRCKYEYEFAYELGLLLQEELINGKDS